MFRLRNMIVTISLHLQTVMRCWDSLFLEGTKVLFRLGLAVLHRNEAKLLQMNDAHEFCVALQSVGALMIDCDALMKVRLVSHNGRMMITRTQMQMLPRLH